MIKMNSLNNLMIVNIFDYIIDIDILKQYDIDDINTNKLLLLLITKSSRLDICRKIKERCRNEIDWIFKYYYNEYSVIPMSSEFLNSIFQMNNSILFQYNVGFKINNRDSYMMFEYYIYDINEHNKSYKLYYHICKDYKLLYSKVFDQSLNCQIDKPNNFMSRRMSDLIMERVRFSREYDYIFRNE
jgi:hypothetical protein